MTKLQSLVKYLVVSATSDFYENASIQAKSMKLGRDIPWAWGNYFGAKLAFPETFNDNLSQNLPFFRLKLYFKDSGRASYASK